MKNRYLDGLLAAPLLNSLSENTRRAITNLLDDQNREELKTFIINKIGESNIPRLSDELATHFGHKRYNFDSVIKEMIKAHRHRKMVDLFADNPLSLKGKILRFPSGGTIALEHEVLQIKTVYSYNAAEGAGGVPEESWALSLDKETKATLHVRDRILSYMSLEFFELRAPLEFIQTVIQDHKSYSLKIVGGNAGVLKSESTYSFDFSSSEKVIEWQWGGTKIIGILPLPSRVDTGNTIYCFTLRSPQKRFTLKLGCDDKQCPISLELLNEHGHKLDFGMEQFFQLNLKVKQQRALSQAEWETIMVKEKVLNAEEVKLKKLQQIDKLKDDIIFALLREPHHLELNKLIKILLQSTPTDYSSALAPCIEAEYDPTLLMFVIQNKLKQIKFCLAGLEAGTLAQPIESILLSLVFTANYLRWLTRDESLSVIKAMDLFNECMPELKKIENKQLVLFLGPTGAGKSTSINFFLNNPLRSGIQCGEEVLQVDETGMDEVLLANVPRIGQSLGTSETAFTKGYKVPIALQEELREEITGISNVLLVDSPGTSDTRGVNYQILTMLSIEQTLRTCEKMRAAVLVVPFSTLIADRGVRLVELMQSYENMLSEAFRVGSDDSRSLYILITKCQNPSDKEAFFEERIQQLLKEDTEQLTKQREAGARYDASDTERRINLWKVLLHLCQNGQVIYLDTTNDIEGFEVLTRFLKCPGIPKHHVKNIFEKEGLKEKFAHYINLSTNTNLGIIRSFLEDIPGEMALCESSMEQKNIEINEAKQAIDQYTAEIERQEAKIQADEDEKQRFEAADLSDPGIQERLTQKIKELQDNKFKALNEEIADAEADNRISMQKVQNIIDTITEKQAQINALEEEQKTRRDEIKRLQEGSSKKELYRYGPYETVCFGYTKSGAREAAYTEARAIKDEEWESDSMKTILSLEYCGEILQLVPIQAEYYLVPADAEQKKALFELHRRPSFLSALWRSESEYAGCGGIYKALLTGKNFKLLRGFAKDRHTIIYEIQLTYDGIVNPYFVIEHTIPNCDLNWSTVVNLDAEIKAKETLIQRYVRENSDLENEKSILELKINEMSNAILVKRADLERSQKETALQTILESLISSMAASRQLIASKRNNIASQMALITAKQEDIVPLKEKLHYFRLKHAHFALIINDKREVIESLVQLCELVHADSGSSATPVPSGLLEQCHLYKTRYASDKVHLWEECARVLSTSHDTTLCIDDMNFYTYFADYNTEWHDFIGRQPIPDMTVIDDPEPEAFLTREETVSDSSEDLSIKIKGEIMRLLLGMRVIETPDAFEGLCAQAQFYDLVPMEIEAAGNCFFQAVSDQLSTRGVASDVSAELLREEVAAFILERQDEFLSLITTLSEDGAEGYLKQAFEVEKWVDEPMIKALANVRGLTFVIIRDDGAKPMIINGKSEGLPVLYLGYLGSRYVSLQGKANAAAIALLSHTSMMSGTERASSFVSSLTSLDRVWRGKYTTKDAYPAYTPVGEKKEGCSIGFIAEKAKTKNEAVFAPHLWMAKLGYPDPKVEGDAFATLTRRRTAHQRSISTAVREKIAADVYFVLGYGYYRVPKHRLATLSITNEFTKKNDTLDSFLKGMNEGKSDSEKTTHGVFLMSKWDKEYKDFSHLNDCFCGEEERYPFMEAILRRGMLPEEAMIEGKRVPLLGLMEILAASRLLGDTDVLGGGGQNAGFVVERDKAGLPIALRAVKIDAGESFNFQGEDNQLMQSFNPCTSANKLSDKKDIQFGNMQHKVIQWSTLSEKQKAAFIETLTMGLEYLKSEANLTRLVHREGQFDEAFSEGASPFSLTRVKAFVDAWLQYLQLQEQKEVYGELLIPSEPFTISTV